jgi:hypothetical protein
MLGLFSCVFARWGIFAVDEVSGGAQWHTAQSLDKNLHTGLSASQSHIFDAESLKELYGK